MPSVIVNGASGWLGTATLRAIERIEDSDHPWERTLLGSHPRTHLFEDFGSYEILDSQVKTLEVPSQDYFVNLAFKTRDYISKLGESEYTRINIRTIKNSIELLKLLKPKSIILVSSGVVTKHQQSEGKLYDDAYTRLKIYEEEEFERVSKEINANLIILRMWAASGADMTEPNKYGIGNLLIQSKISSSVVIESPRPVFRRYADASQQLEICIRLATQGVSETLNSGGTLIEIRDLASIIVSKFSPGKNLIHAIDGKTYPDDYFWPGQAFEEHAKNVNVDLYDVEKQVELTSLSVDRFLRKQSISG
jgi:nucleoside-diphosphate-sugar epimerase